MRDSWTKLHAAFFQFDPRIIRVWKHIRCTFIFVNLGSSDESRYASRIVFKHKVNPTKTALRLMSELYSIV